MNFTSSKSSSSVCYLFTTTGAFGGNLSGKTCFFSFLMSEIWLGCCSSFPTKFLFYLTGLKEKLISSFWPKISPACVGLKEKLIFSSFLLASYPISFKFATSY